jgi:hypothetical protein
VLPEMLPLMLQGRPIHFQYVETQNAIKNKLFLNCQLGKMVKNIMMYTFYRKLLISPAEKYRHISQNLFSLTPQSVTVTG